MIVVLRAASIALALLPAALCTGQTPSSPYTFHDPVYKVSFDYPAAWNFSQRDHEISTFRLDARSAPRNASLRAVVAMPENPFPMSTFSGAYIYLSVTPRTSDSACEKQASMEPASPQTSSVINLAGIPFAHGYTERRDICVVQRDEIYTTRHRGACYRFDLTVNTFCGGQVSGIKDISSKELDEVHARLLAILSTVHFDVR